jgi:hypothetical protein
MKLTESYKEGSKRVVFSAAVDMMMMMMMTTMTPTPTYMYMKIWFLP